MPHSLYHTDQASAVDYLNFSDFRPVLREILINAETPLAIAVYGPWGSGKTTLLRMLRQDIDRSTASFNVRTVWFTAWKYDRSEALWRAFILRILDALYPRRHDGDGWELHERIPAGELNDKEARIVTMLQRLEESIYRPVSWEEIGKLSVNWAQTLTHAGKGAASIAAALFPPAKLGEMIMDILDDKLASATDKKTASTMLRREVHARHLDQLASMEQFEATFREALRLAVGDRGRLIVLVDDLDRCLPEKAIEVLEAIKLFLEVDGTAFVLGMDKEIVERGVELRYGSYKNSPSHLPILGDDYLQKIIQIPFYLPPMGEEDVALFIEQLESQRQDNVVAPELIMEQFSSERILSEATRKIFARALVPNPRQVKRVLNIFRLLQGIALVRERRGSLPPGTVAWPLLAKTVLVQAQFPELYMEWRREPRLIAHLEQELSEPNTEVALEQASSVAHIGPKDDFLRKLTAQFLDQEWHRIGLLRKLLAHTAYDARQKKRNRSRFDELSVEEVRVYLSLAGSVALEGVKAQKLEKAWSELESGDRERVLVTTERLLVESDDERRTNAQWLLHRRLTSGAGSPAQRVAWAEALVQLGKPELAIPTLERESLVNDYHIRRRAVDILVDLRHPGALKALFEWTQSPLEEVRSLALSSLLLMSRAEVEGTIEGMTSLISNKDLLFRAAILGLLGELGDKSTIGAIAACLADKRPEVRAAAASALGFLGALEVKDQIAECLMDAPLVQEKAAEALLRMSEVTPLFRFMDNKKKSAGWIPKLLANRPDLAVMPLVTVISQRLSDDLDRQMAGDMLAAIGAPAVDPLLGVIEGADSATQLLILECLRRIGDYRARDTFLQMVNSANVEVQIAAIKALGELEGAERRGQDLVYRDLIYGKGRRKGKR